MALHALWMLLTNEGRKREMNMQPTDKPQPAATETVTSNEFERLLERAVQRVERAATPSVQPMELRTFDELERWAERAANSDMVPKDYKGKPNNVILAAQFGAEVGLRPMQALWNIAMINGKPSIYGDAMLGLCKTHPAYVSIQETLTGEGDKMVAKCVVVRKGEPPFVGTFSVEDAKGAKLWGKKGYNGQDTPWITNPKRMLQFRARGFVLRDAFPDKLRGLISAEEAQDYPSQSAAPPPAPAEPEDHYPPVEFRPPPKRTVGDWLAALKLELDGAEGTEEYDAILTRENVVKVAGSLKNGAKKQYDDMIVDALDRITGVDSTGRMEQ